MSEVKKRTSDEIFNDIIHFMNTTYMDDKFSNIEVPTKVKELIDEYCGIHKLPISPYDFIGVLIRSRTILARKYRNLVTWLQYEAGLTPEQVKKLNEFIDAQRDQVNTQAG